MVAEQVELPRAVVTFGRDGLVVTAYLGKVGRFELQGKLQAALLRKVLRQPFRGRHLCDLGEHPPTAPERRTAA